MYEDCTIDELERMFDSLYEEVEDLKADGLDVEEQRLEMGRIATELKERIQKAVNMLTTCVSEEESLTSRESQSTRKVSTNSNQFYQKVIIQCKPDVK